MRRRRYWTLIVFVVVAALVPGRVATAGTCWRAPVEAPVSDPYREPACRWCPGNRGIEYRTPQGVAVSAVATGRVSFVGEVVDTRYVVVRHADGLRATYANVSGDRWHVGDVVIRGTRVGFTLGRLHFGVRRGVDYIDPTPLLGRLVFAPRLIPVNGDRPTPAHPPALRCGG